MENKEEEEEQVVVVVVEEEEEEELRVSARQDVMATNLAGEDIMTSSHKPLQ